jgi:hypothetical protein
VCNELDRAASEFVRDIDFGAIFGSTLQLADLDEGVIFGRAIRIDPLAVSAAILVQRLRRGEAAGGQQQDERYE